MDDEVVRSKASLRKHMQSRRSALSEEERRQGSLRAARLAQTLPELAGASRVALYGALPTEIDPAPLAEVLSARSVILAYPRVEPGGLLRFCQATPHTLTRSPKGIPEPFTTAPTIPIHCIDVFFVPGLAFDLEGGRLGFGGGYYDRALRQARSDAFRVGYAFDCQVVPFVPREPHDVLIDGIITEHRVIRPARRPFS